MSAGERELRGARAYLNRVAEPPAPALCALVESLGPVHAARRVARADVPDAVAAETAARRDDDRAEADLSAAAALGARLVIPEDDEWPAWSFACFDTPSARDDERLRAPLGLWARGAARLDSVQQGCTAAVVGARAATGYGEHLAAEFGYRLADRGVVVISGAAYGIDGSAHRGALAAEGISMAVQACGVDRVYPSGHVGLLDRIVVHGAVVSEYPPGTRPAKHRFLVRNRLIAALSAGTVVVEAGRRSGARSTAASAAALGRIVMAVPGPVTSALSVGCHLLLRETDALLVTRAEEVIEAIGRMGTDLAAALPPVTRPTDGLPAELLAVYEALPARVPRHAEQLVRESGVTVQRVRAALPLLELRGLVGFGADGWRRTVTRGSADTTAGGT